MTTDTMPVDRTVLHRDRAAPDYRCRDDESPLEEIMRPIRDARVQAEAARVEAGDPGREPVTCWACSAVMPGQRPAFHGWHSRKVNLETSWMKATEIYCPTCFSEHGWG